MLTLHQKCSLKEGGLGLHSACLLWCLGDEEDQFRLPVSGDPKQGLYEEGFSQSLAQPVGSDCQSVETNMGRSVCWKGTAFHAVK